MKIYEFNYRNGKLTKCVCEVTETNALYKLEKGYFEKCFCSQIRKSEIGNIRYDSFWGFTTISETDNAEDFLEDVIKRQEEQIQRAEEKLAEQKNSLKRLINKDYILVEKQMF